MKNAENKPDWLLNLCKGKSPGVILIDGDGEKTPCLDLACEIGATMMELGVAQRLCVWSWQASLCMNGRFLVGDSAVDTHRWTIEKEVENIPPTWGPLAEALIEDSVDLNILNPIKWCINAPAEMDVESIKSACEYAGDIMIGDLRHGIPLESLARFNGAVKAIGKTFVVSSELLDCQARPYETASYGELAMRISLEQGIDLTECAESIISLRVQDSGQWRNYIPSRELCRPLRIWNDDRCLGVFLVERDENGRFIFEMEENNDETK